MSQSPLDFLNLFVQSPGDLFYFLLVIVISQMSLFMSIGSRGDTRGARAAHRFSYATLGIVLAWVLLLIGSLISLVSDRDSASILPPLERAANIITIVLLGWAFLTADHKRWSRLSTILLLLAIITTLAGYIATGTQWINESQTTQFNLSQQGIIWTVTPLILSALGFILTLLFFRIITDAPLKMVFFAILAFGFGITLYQMTRGQLLGNYAGPARLAFLTALAIMPTVIYRMIISRYKAMVQEPISAPPASALGQAKSGVQRAVTEVTVEEKPPAPAIPRTPPIERQSARLLKVMGDILDVVKPGEIPERTVLSAIDILGAEIGALLRLHDANYADVTIAYDRVMSANLAGIALNLNDQPTLVNAIERAALRTLLPDKNGAELHDLYTRLDINKAGPTYIQPLVHRKEVIAVLVIGMPYSQKELETPEIELLKGVGLVASSLIAVSYAARDERESVEERTIQAMIEGVSPDELGATGGQSTLQLAREQIDQLNRQVTELKIKLDDERTRLAAILNTDDGVSISQQIKILSDEHLQLRQERDRLTRQLQEAQAIISSATSLSDEAVINDMIETLRIERDNLVSERNRLQHQLDTLHEQEEDGIQRADLSFLFDDIAEEKDQIIQERDQLYAQLQALQSQLKALGIESGPAGLSQIIAQLHEQRSTLQEKVQTLQKERDLMKAERNQILSAAPGDASSYKSRIQSLQTEIEHLAADREAAVKQRDKYRIERDEAQSTVDAVKQHRARLLAQVAGHEIELQEIHQEQTRLLTRMKLLADERSNLINDRDQLIAQKQALETERDQLLARSEGDRIRLQELSEKGVGALQRMIEELSDERNQLEQQLNRVNVELADTRQTLDRHTKTAEMKAVALRESNYYQPENPELLMSLVQELRTPMTSITGYVDLLSGESAGILGEMQRKFLNRVSANITRLATMIDDLVHITKLDTGQFHLTPEPIDVIAVIEDTITQASHQFREKALIVDLDLDEEIPHIAADRDSLMQIMTQLLTNAYLVSPAQAHISVSAKQAAVQYPDQKEAVDSLCITVSDKGGGILPDDIPRVFARKYKADNPLIAGLGDTGVGLAIVKALVEAHEGHLWIDVDTGVGSTFNVAIPLNIVAEQG